MDVSEELSESLENAPLSVHWLGADGSILWANRFELDNLGYNRDEYIGHHISEFHADNDVAQDILQRFARHESLHNVEVTLLSKEGQCRHVLISSRPSWKDDKFIHTQCFSIDITARKQADDTLLKSAERFAFAVKGSNDGLWDWDIESDQEWWSARFYELLGYQEGELEASYESFLTLLHPEDKDRTLKSIQAHLEKQLPFDIQYRLQTKSGDYRWFRGRGQAQYEQGKAVRMAGSIRDITARRIANERLDIYQHIVSSSSSFLSFIDKDYIYREVNNAYLTAFGLSREQLVGHSPAEIFGKQLFESTIKPHMARCLTGESHTFEEWLEFPQRGKRLLTVHYDPHRAEDGSVQGLIISGTDITDIKKSEQDLKQSEELLRRYFDSGLVGMSIVGPDMKWVQVNDNYCDIFGYSREELLTMSWPDITYPDDMEISHSHNNAMFAGDIDTYSLDKRYIRKDGEIVYVTVSTECVRKTDGSIDYIVVFSQNITGREKSKLALIQSEEKYRSIVETTSEWICEIDVLTGKHTYCNPAIEAIMGYTAEEFLGMDMLDLIAESDRQRIEAYISQCVADKCGWQKLAIQCQHKDGSVRHLESNATAVFDVEDNLIGFRVLNHDSTERKQAEEKLQASEKQLKEAQRISKLGFWNWDIKNNKLFWSDELYRIVGFKKKGFEATFEAFLDMVHPEDKVYMQERVNKTLNDGADYNFDHRIVLPDGEIRYLHEQAEVTRDDNGNPVRMFGTALDITERKQAEQTLRKSEDLLRRYFDAGLVGMSIATADKTWLHVNDAYCKMLGYSQEELQALSWQDLTHPDDLAASYVVHEQIVAGEINHYSIDKRYIRKNGEIIYCTLSAECFRNEDGTLDSIVGFVQDITDRKLAEQALRKSKEQLQLALEGADMATWELVINTGENIHSERWATMRGYNPDEAMIDFQTWTQHLHPQDKQRVLTDWADHLAGKIPAFECEYRLSIKTGGWMWVMDRGRILDFDAMGKPLRAAGTVVDITELKQATEEIHKLSLSVKHSPNIVIITDKDTRIEYVNPKFTEITGYTEQEALGQKPSLIASMETPAETYENLWETILAGKEWRGELLNKKKNGELYWSSQIIFPIMDADGVINNYVSLHDDITEARIVSDQLSFQATHDLLTGLINRHEFEQRLQRALINAQEKDAEHVMCFLDLDQFKVINDTSGHVAGDELLRQLGSLLSESIRQRDTIARLGGDEFGILMEHCPLHKALHVAEDIRSTIEGFRFEWEGKTHSIGVSIGIAPISMSSQDITEIMKQADSACYAAKDAGRNRIHVYRDDDSALAQRRGEIRWVPEIHAALMEDRFMLYAQPIVAVASSKQINNRYEILIRMKNTDGELINPGAFLPAAERYNLSTRIDLWVIEHVFQWLANNPGHAENIDSLSVNLSGTSLGDKPLLKYIIEQFEASKLAPAKITFEVTETATISNLAQATFFISELREFGCHFALDDFGSGLSSFAYLKNLPIDALKIDGMFVRDMVQDKTDYAMVKMINELGHIMGMQTIAEFVEDDLIFQKLKDIGVDYAQGYHLGKPQPLEMWMPSATAPLTDLQSPG